MVSAFGSVEMATGTIIGSNIANIFLILGASALVSPMVAGREFLRQEYVVLIFSAALAVLLLGNMEWYKGLVLVAMFIAYMHYTLKRRAHAGPGRRIRGCIWKDFTISVIGILLVVLGAKLLVDSAVSIAQAIGIPEIVIALTVIAIGTSLPELATSLVAAYRGMRGIAIGNIIGSNIFNITTLGMTSLIRTVPATAAVMLIDIPIMLFATILLMLVIRFRGTLSRPMGAAFIAMFIIFLALQALAAG